VDLYLTSEEVLKVHSAAKKVRTESHLMLGLLRFKKLKGGLYYAPYSPVYNITVFGVCPINFGLYNTSKCVFTDLPAELQYQSAKTDDQFEELWKNYFNSICIKDRVNPKLQKQNWLKNNKCTFYPPPVFRKVQENPRPILAKIS